MVGSVKATYHAKGIMTIKQRAEIILDMDGRDYQVVGDKCVSNQEFVETMLKDLRNETINECYDKIIECFPVLACVTTLSICLSQLKE